MDNTVLSFIVILLLLGGLWCSYRTARNLNTKNEGCKKTQANWADYLTAILFAATYALTIGGVLDIHSPFEMEIHFAKWGIFTAISSIAIVTLGLFLNELGKKAEQSTQDETEQEQK